MGLGHVCFAVVAHDEEQARKIADSLPDEGGGWWVNDKEYLLTVEVLEKIGDIHACDYFE